MQQALIILAIIELCALLRAHAAVNILPIVIFLQIAKFNW